MLPGKKMIVMERGSIFSLFFDNSELVDVFNVLTRSLLPSIFDI